MPSDFTWNSWIGSAVAIGTAIVVAAAALALLALVANLISRRVPWVRDLARRVRNAMIVAAAVVAIWIAASVTEPAEQSGGHRCRGSS